LNKLLKKVRNSQKVIRLLRSFGNFCYYFSDNTLTIYSGLKNLITKRKLYEKNFTVLTGSDERFFDPLKQLLNNLKIHNYINNTIVYDLGLKNEQVKELTKDFSEIKIMKFDFEESPNFISERDSSGTLGAYAWKANIVFDQLKTKKEIVIWMDAANLINKKFKRVLIVLTNMGFFSPVSAGTVKNYTHPNTIQELNYPSELLGKRNLTGGFVGFDYNNPASLKLAKNWQKYSNIKDLILPSNSVLYNHRHDQSILSILFYKDDNFGQIPKMKSNFGIKVNRNPKQDVFLFKSDEEDQLSEIYKNWYNEYKHISTKTVAYSKIIYLLSPYTISKIPKKYLKTKIVVTNLFSLEDYQFIQSNKNNKFIDCYFVFDHQIKETISNESDKEVVIFTNPNEINKIKEGLLSKIV
jgi:hypothetical protein